MKVGIFGQSKATFKSSRGKNHYTQKVIDYFPQHSINWYGSHTASVERITNDINKNRCDLYLVMHSTPDCVYCPGWERDFTADYLFREIRSPTGWRRFKRASELYNICLDDNILEKIDFYKTVFYNSNRPLNYISNLFLMKSVLTNKKVIHVSHNNAENKVFKGAYFSQTIYEAVFSLDPHNYASWDHELISNVFIREIELALNK